MNRNLLFLHGALGTKKQFGELKEILSKSFNVYDLDFYGHGKSQSSKDFMMDLFAEQVSDFLQEKNIDKTNIFGYSMGGYVALNLAIKKPALIEQIITLGTKFDWTAANAAKEIKMLNPEKIEEKVPAFANKLKAIHAANDWKTVLHRTAKMMQGLGEGDALNLKQLSQLKHKILIGIGDQDRMVSIEESSINADNLPNGRLQIIEGVQHQIEKTNKQEFAKVIEKFLIKS